MCSNYQPPTRDQFQDYFDVAPPDVDYKPETWPGYLAPLIRLSGEAGAAPQKSCELAMFGMVPHWADPKLARQTYNARTETVAAKPSFRHAVKQRQFCVIPARSIYEPCYEIGHNAGHNAGKAERYEITHADGTPLAIAGIWEYKHDGPGGQPLLSFSMLTINADGHPLMQRFHKPDAEKRMLVLLHPSQHEGWLRCRVADAPQFFVPYPAELLRCRSAPKGG